MASAKEKGHDCSCHGAARRARGRGEAKRLGEGHDTTPRGAKRRAAPRAGNHCVVGEPVRGTARTARFFV